VNRLHPDDILAIAERVVSLLGGSVQPARPTLLTPAQRAIQMAREGDIEGSKAFLKSLSKRGSKHAAGTVQGMCATVEGLGY